MAMKAQLKKTLKKHYDIYVKFAVSENLPIDTIEQWSNWNASTRQEQPEVRTQQQSRTGENVRRRAPAGEEQGTSSPADDEASAEQRADPPRKRRRTAQLRSQAPDGKAT